MAGKGWVPVNQMVAGDRLVGLDGQEVVVSEVVDTGEYVRVYNFRMADHHTYFVGGEEWGFSVWTHNSYGPLKALPGAASELTEQGRRLATRAKDLLTKSGLSKWEKGATTVAVGLVLENGKLVEKIVVYGPKSALKKIQKLAPEAVQAEGGMHAETFLYLLNGGRATVKAIGVSHWKGPCKELCRPFFTNRGFNNIWWFGWVR